MLKRRACVLSVVVAAAATIGTVDCIECVWRNCDVAAAGRVRPNRRAEAIFSPHLVGLAVGFLFCYYYLLPAVNL